MNWIPIDSTEHERRIDLWRQMENIYTPNWEELSAVFYAPNITAEELTKRYAAGETNFIDISLPEKSDLIGINLTRTILLGARFNHANLTNANLSSTDFRCAWISGVDFTGANLEGANVGSASTTGTIFRNASLRNIIENFGIEWYAVYENTIIKNGILFKGLSYGE